MKEMILKFWKRWFGKEAAGQVMNPVCHETKAAVPKAEKPSAPLPMLDRLEGYLFDRYDFRFNVLTEQAEYTPKGKDHYQLADQRTLNTFCIEARAACINCWDKDVSRLLCSQKIADFPQVAPELLQPAPPHRLLHRHQQPEGAADRHHRKPSFPLCGSQGKDRLHGHRPHPALCPAESGVTEW